MRAFRTALLLLGALHTTPGIASADSATSSPDSAVLDFDKLAEQVKERRVPVSSADLPKLPPGFENEPPVPLRLSAKPDLVQAYLRCPEKRCNVRVVLMTQQGQDFTVTAKLDLPTLPRNFSGLSFEQAALFDITGDGKEELLVRYTIHGPDRAALGPLHTDMLAVVNVPEMTLALTHELAWYGNPEGDPRCEVGVSRLDLNGDRRQDLRFSRTCSCPKDAYAPCRKGGTEEFLATPNHRFTARPASRPAPKAK